MTTPPRWREKVMVYYNSIIIIDSILTILVNYDLKVYLISTNIAQVYTKKCDHFVFEYIYKI